MRACMWFWLSTCIPWIGPHLLLMSSSGAWTQPVQDGNTCMTLYMCISHASCIVHLAVHQYVYMQKCRERYMKGRFQFLCFAHTIYEIYCFLVLGQFSFQTSMTIACAPKTPMLDTAYCVFKRLSPHIYRFNSRHTHCSS
jgi:hypothetical protein